MNEKMCISDELVVVSAMLHAFSGIDPENKEALESLPISLEVVAAKVDLILDVLQQMGFAL